MIQTVKAIAAMLALAGTLGACATAPGPGPQGEKILYALSGERPAGAPEGSCWGKRVTPAVIEVVTEHVLIQPAELTSQGEVIRQPVYRTTTRQEIVSPRLEQFFELPCPDIMTPEFVASLQRALDVRGFYHGPVTGTLDARTQQAIRRFQAARGLDSEILAMETARVLGLVAYARS